MTLRDITIRLGLDRPPKRVLIVEDHLPTLARLAELWAEMGHQVVAMVGVAKIEGDRAFGLGPDLRSEVEIDLRTVDVAFLDHYFISRAYNGALLAAEIRKRGDARVLGMSSDAAANASMARHGAALTIRKAELINLLPATA